MTDSPKKEGLINWAGCGVALLVVAALVGLALYSESVHHEPNIRTIETYEGRNRAN